MLRENKVLMSTTNLTLNLTEVLTMEATNKICAAKTCCKLLRVFLSHILESLGLDDSDLIGLAAWRNFYVIFSISSDITLRLDIFFLKKQFSLHLCPTDPVDPCFLPENVSVLNIIRLCLSFPNDIFGDFLLLPTGAKLWIQGRRPNPLSGKLEQCLQGSCFFSQSGNGIKPHNYLVNLFSNSQTIFLHCALYK